jgi:PAS domain S-box-containing protein
MNRRPDIQQNGNRCGIFYRIIHSIKTQLAVALLAAALIPLSVVTAVNRQSIGREVQAAGFQALQGAARQTAQRLDAFIAMGLYHGTAAAALPELHDFLKNPEESALESVRQTLKSIADQNPVFIRHATLLDSQGNIIASSSQEGAQPSHHLLPETMSAAMETGLSALSPVHFDEGRAYLCFYSPVMENGGPVGMLRISYSAAVLQQLVTRDTGLLGVESFPVLLDENGLQLAHGVLPHGRPEDLYVLCDKHRSSEELENLIACHRLPADYKAAAGPECPEPDGSRQGAGDSLFFTTRLPLTHSRTMAGAVVPVQNMPWRVIFFQPQDVLLRPVYLQQKNALLTGGLLAFITVLAACWLVRAITGPIALLTGIARKAAQEMRPLPLHIRSRNEVGVLAQTFNRLFEVLEQSRQELVRSEEHLRITMSSIGDGVITTDIESRITGMNPAAEAIIEQSLSAVKGRRLSEVLNLFNASTRQPVSGIAEETFTAGRSLGLPAKTVLITADKKEKFIADSAAPLRDTAGKITGCVLAIRDITEKQRLENSLTHSRKMEALGQLAGGVAHDFNNMLTPILGAAQILESGDLPAEERIKCAGMIATAAKRASVLTQQMLTFSRKLPANTVPVDLREVVQESRSMLQHSIGPHISIRTHCPLQPLMTMGDAAQIQNVFLNLALNARDAMPDRGILTFKLKQTHLDAEYCRLHSYEIAPGPYIEVQVSDTGCGMDDDTLSKIFDPFFTTKGAGRGTGLGLASVYGIMKSHDGLVTVYSEKGHGTVFHLYFPETETPPETGRIPLPVPSGKGHILLIDDEEGVREITKKMLETIGYTVQCASSGAEGLEAYRAGQHGISAVLLDLMMPGINGEDTFAGLRQINPCVKVVLISGFDAAGAIARLLGAGAVDFVQKPFQMAALAKALRTATQEYS